MSDSSDFEDFCTASEGRNLPPLDFEITAANESNTTESLVTGSVATTSQGSKSTTTMEATEISHDDIPDDEMSMYTVSELDNRSGNTVHTKHSNHTGRFEQILYDKDDIQ